MFGVLFISQSVLLTNTMNCSVCVFSRDL